MQGDAAVCLACYSCLMELSPMKAPGSVPRAPTMLETDSNARKRRGCLKVYGSASKSPTEVCPHQQAVHT